MHVLSIFGTRPEAIKMAPLVSALAAEPQLRSTLCITGQHREMLAQAMGLFGLKADRDLDVMQPDQTLNQLSARLTTRMDEVLRELRPDCVLVHGDTTTAAACALAAFHLRIPVGHVEAGLRSGDMKAPFPEEMNRRVVDVMSEWMFAPTPAARDALRREHLGGRAWVTGNTVIDALAATLARLDADPALSATVSGRYAWLTPGRRLVLVTGHRRENFGEGFRNICAALRELALRDDVEVVYPVHMNPNVRGVVMQLLHGLPNVHLIEPVGYLDFIWLMRRAHLILTDSGGVQEEAPHLGKPVLVMRDVTERPEAVAAGTAHLVGTAPERILRAARRLLDDADAYAEIGRRGNPYGDGHACRRIVDALCGRPVAEFAPPPLQPASVPSLDFA
ncbi:UDP-N-acetylglucosamine 2-epimerase (non-hydrolysing) [Pseudacidovorax intermedius]|uniref:UDP-N-acetylglucosamine 2-epimerase (non-hydrolyzing) n=2 Tax=Pseudacidovorax intermedius TaxID=433924 RepID=A0A370FDP7_9BURK|nr:UDP-N-acetylglucosamine 2-epimerase (non-hydrolyzing) [Pseudacidovorax intermedius]RDI21922.1 UDP-N-acetylglucosamine 2-epimerase (non-hydrolysing) [Pseudacidovorax intermedius]